MRVVPGIHSVMEGLKVRPRSVTQLILREGSLNSELEDIYQFAQKNKIKVLRKPQGSLDKEGQSNQGVIAYISDSPEWPTQSELKSKEHCIILALDCLEDPHNVGSLMRTSWCLGVSGVMITRDRSAGMTPAAHKVASGAFEHVPVLEVVNLHSELQVLKDIGFWVYGLDAEGATELPKAKLPNKAVLVIGSEAEGLRKSTITACDELLCIPQVEGAQSLNASVAGAVGLYEIVRGITLSKNVPNSTKKL